MKELYYKFILKDYSDMEVFYSFYEVILLKTNKNASERISEGIKS